MFPNTIRINAVERNELLCVKGFSDNVFKSFMIMDDELKVLKTEKDYVNKKTNAIFVNFESENSIFVESGQVFLDETKTNLLKNLTTELLAYNNNVVLLKANFEEITFSFVGEDSLKIKMRSGTEIVLKDTSTKFSEKFMLGLSTYDKIENKSSSKITVYENNDGKVVGYYY